MIVEKSKYFLQAMAAVFAPMVKRSPIGTMPTVAHESGIDETTAERLAVIGEKVRNLREHGFEEGVSTRLLIYTVS